MVKLLCLMPCRWVVMKLQSSSSKQMQIPAPRSVGLECQYIMMQQGTSDAEISWVKLLPKHRCSCGRNRRRHNQILLDHGADPGDEDDYGERPIMWAAAKGCEIIVKMLLVRGVNADKVDQSGESPLLWAMRTCICGLHKKVTRCCPSTTEDEVGDREAVVKLLLRYGANPHIQGQDGQMPLSLAVNSESEALVEYLPRAGCDPNVN